MARSPEVVLDASVVAKWVLPEPGSDVALAIRDAHVDGRIRILAPELLWYELANAIRHHPGMRPELARDILSAVSDAQLTLYRPTLHTIERATDLAFRAGLTVYDACYASLAEDHDCAVVTEDRRLLQRCSRATPLRSWPIP